MVKTFVNALEPQLLLWAEPGGGLAGWLQRLSPDECVLLATLGFALILLELNRPGLIVSGAAGLLMVLLAAAGLRPFPLSSFAIGLLTLAVVVLALNLWLQVPVWLLALATAGLCAGLRVLVSPGNAETVHLPVALACGTASGTAAAYLSRVALRARRAKQVN